MANSIPVIVNRKSGPDGEDPCDQVGPAFAAHGLQARVIVLQPGDDIARTVEGLLQAGARTVVAGGGDGTINAVAACLLDRDVTLGVLPLGTLNHFARDLGIPFELDQAAGIIAAGRTRTTDVGEVNDHVFLNNSSMGMYPRIVNEREEAQHRLGLGKWPALARATWRALRDPSSFNAVVCVDGRTLERRTPFIFVGNNCYVMEGFGLGRRACLDDGVLSLYVLRPKTTLGFLWLGLRALLGIGTHARDFDHFQAETFEIRAAHGDNEVATDGEVTTMAPPIRYRVRKRALRVFAPEAAPAKDTG